MRKSSKRSTGRNVLVDRDTTNSNSTTTGCMCAFFQLFDFISFPLASNLHHNETQPCNFNPIISTSKNNSTTTTFELPEEPSIPKGMEAPRNSLKSEEGSTSLSSIIEDEEVTELSFKNIQMGINQIKTSCGNNGGNYTPSRSSTSKLSIPSSSELSPATTDFYTDNSPATKTPSLVARLMGLDLLPETSNSPTYNYSITSQSPTTNPQTRPRSGQALRNRAKHLMDASDVTASSGTRSLPETPRISSARRSDADVHHHRLSLQIINKENVRNSTDGVDFDFSRLSSLRRNKHDNHGNGNDKENCCESGPKSPAFYARQIVKQVKESVTRRAGLDITNSADHNYNKRSSSKLGEQASNNKHTNNSPSTVIISSSSFSPRLKIPNSSSMLSSGTEDQSFQVSKPTLVSSSLSSRPAKEGQQEKGKRSKASGNYNDRRMMVMQEETFVFGPKTNNKKKKKITDHHHHQSTNNYKRANISIPDKTKCKEKPLSNNLLTLNAVPTLVSVKKNANDVVYDHHKFQAGVESKSIIKSTSHNASSQSHNKNECHVADTSSGKNDAVALRHYVARILGRTGMSTTCHVSFANWFSPSHPLDPSIFHRLELHYSNNIYLKNSHQRLVSPKSNRKLVFDIVDELLVDILRPHINLKPWAVNNSNNNKMQILEGKDLIETLCSRVEGFPYKDCQVLEDIDALIDQDLCDNHIIKTQNKIAFQEEGEALVMEIEKDLVDTLVHETALIFIANYIQTLS